MEIADTTEIPMTQFLPTHIGRSQALFDQAITYAQQGGYLDFTTSSDQANAVSCVAAVKTLLEKNVPIENITFTSDGQGSLPQFDAQGNLEGLGVGAVTSLYETVRQGILDHDLAIEELLKVITQNPANILKLQSKGEIRENNDADLVIVDQDDLTIDTVIAMGEIMVQNKTIEVKGTFE
jgi:beta-aspartyl-dipeptidase (metallo-type)